MSGLMSILLMVGGLALGVILVVKGSDVFIDGAASIAKRFGVSQAIIGLTLVALATSLPELAVSLAASFEGAGPLAFGTVIGSNVANICLVLGLSAIISPLVVSKEGRTHAIVMALITLILYLFVAFDNVLTAGEGMVFLGIYIVFTYYLVRTRGEGDIPMDAKIGDERPGKSVLLALTGCAAVVLGARVLIYSATSIALELGVSQFVIGITMVAVGTSLPELASSVTAAVKKYYGIAVGNVIGSNIINIVLVLGLASVINPIPVSASTIKLTLPFVLGISMIMVPAMGRNLTKWVGAALIVMYGVFIAILFL